MSRAGLRKWLWCSWAHREHRCYPEVWLKMPGRWHCARCTPCGLAFAPAAEQGEQRT